MKKLISKQTILACCISLAISPVLAETGVNITAGNEYTTTEGGVYDQAVGPSGIFYVNGGILNIEPDVTVDTTSSTVNSTGYGILILGDGSRVNGTNGLTIKVSQSQTGIGFNTNSSNAIISLGDNATIVSENFSAIRVAGTGNTMLIGDNLNLESSYVPLSISGQNTNTIIGENSVLSATNGSSIVLNGQNNNLSIGDGGVFHATGYGLNLSGANNSVNLGSVQVTGSRAVLMSGENNTLTVASGSILNGIPSVADPDGSVLAIGGINNTITVDNSVLKSNGSQIIRLSGSGANVKNDGNTINLNNLSIINDYDNPTFENDDSVIGILTTNNEQLDSEYEFTLNLNSGTIETTNSNLINTDMQQHQNSSEMSTAKALININDVTMNNSNGLYLILFGTSDLSQNATDLTFNLIRTDASSFSKGILNNDQSVLKLNLDSSKISGDIVNNTGSQGNMQINGNNGSFITGNIYALDDSGNIDTENAYTSVTLDNSSWIHDNNSHIVDLTNGGNVIFNSPDYGHTLTVHGNYTGNNGHILFNGQLEGDDSVTDKLIIAGNTSGTTSVSVNNIGGQGAQTIDGIELISVGGDSAGNFEQLGRIVAGAYEYFLNRGEGENSKNWYLTNQLDEPDGPDVAIIRPEAGGYINNLSMANQLFNTRLHDRLGETQYTDILTGEKKVTSMWLRNVAGHTNAKSADGQLKTGNMWGGDQYCTN